ncbi:MAG: 3-phosphoshikimate 1-carboxyvinyltransferase, partial [Treponema sp.]|nr:3-phosphoshikimate 1-carboxyvinyltransferase [Treponema sp.]
MNIISTPHKLSGKITVPGSKSHTIRALILSALAEGSSKISNPLSSADCLSAANAIPLLGAGVDFGDGSVWTVQGAGKNLHLPDDLVNVGNSGSLLYFLSPICSTFEGTSVFTGDASIRKRPVFHVADVIKQMGADAWCAIPGSKTCPLVVRGKADGKNVVRTEGSISSQYITGMMMAALRLPNGLSIELSDPKETPYLTMTKVWLEEFGATVKMSDDFKKISVTPPAKLLAKDFAIPSDWEGVAFPLIAALLTDSKITIENVDLSGSQGDDKIVEVLRSVGADIAIDKEKSTLTVTGGKPLSARNLPDQTLRVPISGFPDAICALAVAACFIEGKTIIEDAAVCRRKETDRISTLKVELEKAGAKIEEGPDYMVIHGGQK